MPLYSFVLRLLERAKYIMFMTSIEMHKSGKTLLVLVIGLPALRQWKKYVGRIDLSFMTLCTRCDGEMQLPTIMALHRRKQTNQSVSSYSFMPS